MTFKEWFNSAPHRAKYTDDHPAYLAAKEAWDAAHEACAKVCESISSSGENTDNWTITRDKAFQDCANAIRARGQE